MKCLGMYEDFIRTDFMYIKAVTQVCLKFRMTNPQPESDNSCSISNIKYKTSVHADTLHKTESFER